MFSQINIEDKVSINNRRIGISIHKFNKTIKLYLHYECNIIRFQIEDIGQWFPILFKYHQHDLNLDIINRYLQTVLNDNKCLGDLNPYNNKNNDQMEVQINPKINFWDNIKNWKQLDQDFNAKHDKLTNIIRDLECMKEFQCVFRKIGKPKQEKADLFKTNDKLQNEPIELRSNIEEYEAEGIKNEDKLKSDHLRNKLNEIIEENNEYKREIARLKAENANLMKKLSAKEALCKLKDSQIERYQMQHSNTFSEMITGKIPGTQDNEINTVNNTKTNVMMNNNAKFGDFADSKREIQDINYMNIAEMHSATITDELMEIVESWDIDKHNNEYYEQFINDNFGTTISEYDTTLCSESNAIQINIQELGGIGKNIKVDINPNAIIKNVKETIQTKLNYEPQKQRLIYGGKQLEDERTLKEYNIFDNATIHLVLTLRGGCFVGDTKILLSTLKEMNICDINIGDKVLSFNFDANKEESHRVKNVLKYEVNELVKITFDNGSSIICTASHPFYVPQKQKWCCIQPMDENSKYHKLYINDVVINYKSQMMRITNIEYEYINNGDTVTVYTLHLDKIHNFYANGILVHNAMQIFIKTKSGKTYTLDVEPNHTIKTVKVKLSKQSNICVEEQRLVIGKKQLYDDKTLKEYRIKKESTLYLVSNFDKLESLNINPSKKLTKSVIPKVVAEQFCNIYHYMYQYALFHGNHSLIKCNNGKNLIIDYNFHSKTIETEILYVICDKKMNKNNNGFEWKTRDKLYNDKQIENIFKISQNMLPTPIKMQSIFMEQLKRNMDQIRSILLDEQKRNKLLIKNKKIPWNHRDKIPIFDKKSKSSLSLRLSNEEFVKKVREFANENVDNIMLVPIVSMNQYQHFGIEIIWIVNIGIDINIGISLKLNNESRMVLGIYLDINDQHKLIPYEQHNCQCLTNFICNIDNLVIGDGVHGQLNKIKMRNKTLQQKFNDARKLIETLENAKRSDLCIEDIEHCDIPSVSNTMITHSDQQKDEEEEEEEEEKEAILPIEKLTPNGTLDKKYETKTTEPLIQNVCDMTSEWHLDRMQQCDCKCLAAQQYQTLQTSLIKGRERIENLEKYIKNLEDNISKLFILFVSNIQSCNIYK